MLALVAQLAAECFDEGRFAGTRHAGYTDANGVAGVRQAQLNHFLSYRLVGQEVAFHQCHRLTENGHVAITDTLEIGFGSKHRLLATESGVGVDARQVLYACIDGQSFVFFAIFGMINHSTVKRRVIFLTDAL